MNKKTTSQLNTTDTRAKISETIEFLRKPDLNKETSLIFIGKILIFFLLVFFEVVIIAQHASEWAYSDQWWRIGLTVFVELILTGTEAYKLFIANNRRERTICYTLDFLSSFLLVIITSSAFLSVLYLLILTDIYISTEKIIPATVVFAICIPSYVALYSIVLFLQAGDQLSILQLFARTSTAIVALSLHFVITNFVMMFYRQYLKLNKTVQELDESRRKLQKAYEAVAEVTALEERQRIAKDIHDTAGHSITTVIMQTESAKRIIDTNPEEAKAKIVAANLQAKHALEELRDSVHLLSGRTEKQPLQTSLQAILNESTDGTGIVIRSAIEEIDLPEAQARFLCNSLKEGISNGIRHGAATAFWFELKAEENTVEFLLSDNGKGMSDGELRAGFGLSAMQDRAQYFGGNAEFQSEADEGFEIRISLPFNKGERIS